MLCESHLATTLRGLSQIPPSAGKVAPTRLSFPKKELLAELFLFGLRLHRSMYPSYFPIKEQSENQTMVRY